MKKNILISVLLVCCLFFVCAEGSVVMLRDDGPLRVESETNVVSWSTTVPAGTVLTLAESGVVTKDLKTSAGITKDVDFYHVTYNSKDYYVAAYEVVESNSPAVIWEDATLYTKPCIADFRNAILEIATIVVPMGTVTDNGITFTEVRFYDTTSGSAVVKTRYVLSSKISNNSKDVKAVQMLEKAKAETDQELKMLLLSNALAIEMSPRISLYIDSESYEMMNGTSEE